MNEEQETYQVEQCRECHYFEACGGAKKGNGPMPDSTCIVAKVVQSDGVEALEKLKEELLWEINSNRILGKEIDNFDMKIGWNAEAPYVLPNGEEVDFMCAHNVYFMQTEIVKPLRQVRVLVADDKFIMVWEMRYLPQEKKVEVEVIWCQKRGGFTEN